MVQFPFSGPLVSMYFFSPPGRDEFRDDQGVSDEANMGM